MSAAMSPVAAPALDDPLQTLNPEQRAAACHQGGPLLVVAGAGSGKTMTLAARVAHLVLQGADPQRILLLTFSRRAALEMQRRTGHLLHRALGLKGTQAAPALPWAGTFHSVGARLLRESAEALGLSPQFSILDRGDAEDLMALVRQEQGLSATERRFPMKGTCLSIYSRCVNSQAPLAAVLAQAFPWCADWEDELKRLFKAYAAAKQDQQALDYDDLLLSWLLMLQEPTLAAAQSARFDHVLVDEYQDTNRLQAGILHALKPTGEGVTVVGDDAQSIYGFRAAEVRNMLDFPARFSPPARVLTLERNYRSTQPILDASNAVMALAPERFAKTLWTDKASSAQPRLVTVEDDAAQARWVAQQILARREEGMTLKRQAVLFRTSHHSATLELELTRRRIPFVKFGGLKFLEASHVKDVLALLRWADNPRCRLAGLRTALLVPGIGPAHARRLLDAMDAASDPAAALRAYVPPAAAATDWQALATLWLALRQDAGTGWPGELQRIVDWYAPHLERLNDHPVPRLADLAQLAAIAGSHRSRERFLTELALDPPEAGSDTASDPLLDEDYLILSTIHSAKGQEWQAVYLLNVVDGCIPGDLGVGTPEEIEEERRLLYVAMTRARQHLDLMVPQRFYVTQQGRHGDRHLYGPRSRFIPDAMAAEHFERITPRADGALPTAPPAGLLDLRARLRGQWD
ncbi:ATP-dependent helicase [Ideonella benzenivorans]|uniref:ATP-dependent helicase n=1 Tax=Ideonella benzenivorans TaxID=2831643 RepID=UPI0035C17C2A